MDGSRFSSGRTLHGLVRTRSHLVVSRLPSTADEGDVRFLSTDDRLYRWAGGWVHVPLPAAVSELPNDAAYTTLPLVSAAYPWLSAAQGGVSLSGFNKDLAWGDVTGKPATFPPESHGHAWGDVTSKPATFSPSAHGHPWGELTGVPTTFAPSTHSHPWGEVTGKPSLVNTLNGLSGTLTLKSHTKLIDVTASGGIITIDPHLHKLVHESTSDTTPPADLGPAGGDDVRVQVVKDAGTGAPVHRRILAYDGASGYEDIREWAQILSKPTDFPNSAHATGIGTLTTGVGTLTTGVASNSAAIATLTTDVAANTTAIATNASNIGTLVTEVAANTSAATANTTAIASNTINTAINATAIATNVVGIVTNATAIATHTSNIGTLVTEVAANTAASAANTTATASNLININANTADIGNLFTTTYVLDTRLTTAEAGLADYQGGTVVNDAPLYVNTTYVDNLPGTYESRGLRLCATNPTVSPASVQDAFIVRDYGQFDRLVCRVPPGRYMAFNSSNTDSNFYIFSTAYQDAQTRPAVRVLGDLEVMRRVDGTKGGLSVANGIVASAPQAGALYSLMCLGRSIFFDNISLDGDMLVEGAAGGTVRTLSIGGGLGAGTGKLQVAAEASFDCHGPAAFTGALGAASAEFSGALHAKGQLTTDAGQAAVFNSTVSLNGTVSVYGTASFSDSTAVLGAAELTAADGLVKAFSVSGKGRLEAWADHRSGLTFWQQGFIPRCHYNDGTDRVDDGDTYLARRKTQLASDPDDCLIYHVPAASCHRFMHTGSVTIAEFRGDQFFNGGGVGFRCFKEAAFDDDVAVAGSTTLQGTTLNGLSTVNGDTYHEGDVYLGYDNEIEVQVRGSLAIMSNSTVTLGSGVTHPFVEPAIVESMYIQGYIYDGMSTKLSFYKSARWLLQDNNFEVCDLTGTEPVAEQFQIHLPLGGSSDERHVSFRTWAGYPDVPPNPDYFTWLYDQGSHIKFSKDAPTWDQNGKDKATWELINVGANRWLFRNVYSGKYLSQTTGTSYVTMNSNRQYASGIEISALDELDY